MKFCGWLCFALLTFASSILAEVTPELEVGTRGVVSANFDDTGGTGSSTVSDFSDTSVLFGLGQKLYSNWRGRFVLGFQFPDAESDLGEVFYHQVFVQVEDRRNVIKIGRSRVKSAMIEFPTLRDDDALGLTDVLNPFSDGENTEDSQYGNVIEVAHLFGRRFWLTAHGEHYRKTTVPGESETSFDLNAAGVWLEYRVPESQRWNRGVLDQVGLGINNFRLEAGDPGIAEDQTLTSILVSTVLNVRPDPVHFWDIRLQAIGNQGLDGIRQLSDRFAVARARSLSAFGSLRYLFRKLERPAAQISLSFGVKEYPDLLNDTSQRQVIVNGLWRIGDNFDVIGQLQYRDNRGDLGDLFGRDETRLQVGFVYSFGRVFNKQFGDRDSLLNLEHDYIP